MKITIEKGELQRKLADIQTIVERKSTVPILSHFLLQLDNPCIIYATDLETALKEPLAAEGVEEPLSLCIPAKKLYEIARELDDQIVLQVDDGDWVKIKSGKTSFRLACLNAADYPHWPSTDEKISLSINPQTLLTIIDKTIYCSGENDSRYALNSMLFHLRGENKQAAFVGTDGHRLAILYQNLGINIEEERKLIIPRKAISELKRILSTPGYGEDDITIEVTKNYVRFLLEDKEFLTKIVEGNYPLYDQVVPKNNDKKIIVDRGTLIRVMKRVSVINRDKSQSVKVEVEQATMSVSANDPEIGEARDSLEIVYEGDPLILGFNARFVIDALTAMETERAEIHVLDKMSPTLFKEEGNDDYHCVIMPMRI